MFECVMLTAVYIALSLEQRPSAALSSLLQAHVSPGPHPKIVFQPCCLHHNQAFIHSTHITKLHIVPNKALYSFTYATELSETLRQALMCKKQ